MHINIVCLTGAYLTSTNTNTNKCKRKRETFGKFTCNLTGGLLKEGGDVKERPAQYFFFACF